MSDLGRALGALILAVTALTATAGETKPGDEAKSLIGKEFPTSSPPARINPEHSCVFIGGEMGGTLPDGTPTSRITLECGDRYILAITGSQEIVGERTRRERILDTLLLPPHVLVTWSGDPPAPLLLHSDQCQLEGNQDDVRFVVVGRLHGRETIDADTGVDFAWILDFDKEGRFIPVDTRRVTCLRMDEP